MNFANTILYLKTTNCNKYVRERKSLLHTVSHIIKIYNKLNLLQVCVSLHIYSHQEMCDIIEVSFVYCIYLNRFDHTWYSI